MRDQEIIGLWEAYQQVHAQEEVEQIDEGKSSRPRYASRGVLDQETRDEKREASAENMRGHTGGPGTVTKNPKKLRKQKAMGEIEEAMSSYDRNRQRAAQRAAARNAARAQGKTGAVPGVGYVTPRKEKETWTDERGQERHTSGARMPKKEDQKESFDLFDVILEHLVAEGYADTNKAAIVIMANMSEDWKQSIVEVLDTPERANEYAKKNVRSMLGAFAKGVVNKDSSQLKTIEKRKRGAEMGKRKAERKAAEEES